MVSSVSSSVSSVGVSVKVAAPLAAPAAMEMSKDDTAAKSTAPAVPLPATLTLTVFASANRVVPSTVAVTVIVVAPSPSPTSSSSTVSVIVSGAPSSSVIVPSTLSAVATTPLRDVIVAFAALLHVTTTVSSGSFTVSPVTDTLRVRLVVPAAKVSVPPAIAA